MIEAAALTKRFGDQVAVGRALVHRAGRSGHAILGPNGAGKTTTFWMLLGLACPSAGSALIDGRPYAEFDRPRETVGAVPESSDFHPARSGRDHLRVIARAAGFSRGRVDELLDFVRLARAADKGVGGYSTGMRQRLAVAAALLGDPRVVVLDEPTSGLDRRRLAPALAARVRPRGPARRGGEPPPGGGWPSGRPSGDHRPRPGAPRSGRRIASALTEPFRRLGAARTGGGLGLGLSIAATVAHAHGGELAIDPLDGGLRISVTLRTVDRHSERHTEWDQPRDRDYAQRP